MRNNTPKPKSIIKREQWGTSRPKYEARTDYPEPARMTSQTYITHPIYGTRMRGLEYQNKGILFQPLQGNMPPAETPLQEAEPATVSQCENEKSQTHQSKIPVFAGKVASSDSLCVAA